MAPLSSLPISDITPYVPVPDPDIEAYKDRADIDVVHLVIVVPYIPGGN